mmetsp:Transcript_54861/g.101500  ORF Transcript_54861/g.101500 Transcript_54861/m.101500 type:complete len:308 (-) Transcript_54861:211-1134(-)
MAMDEFNTRWTSCLLDEEDDSSDARSTADFHSSEGLSDTLISWEDEDVLSACAMDFVSDLLEYAVDDFSDEAVHEIAPMQEATLLEEVSDDEDNLASADVMCDTGGTVDTKMEAQPFVPVSPRVGRNPRRGQQQVSEQAVLAPPSPRSRKPSPRRTQVPLPEGPCLVPRPPAMGTVSARPVRKHLLKVNKNTEQETEVPNAVAAPQLQPLKVSPRRSSSASCRTSALEMDLAAETSVQSPRIDWFASLNTGTDASEAPSLWAKAPEARVKAQLLPKLSTSVAQSSKVDWSMNMIHATAQRRFSRSVF